jgi:hypothetical protein
VKLVQFDFPFQGPFGDDMAAALKDLAESINGEPGFLWKIWTENAEAKEGGGIYLFEDDASAKAYVAKHTARLQAFGVTTANAKVFDVNQQLSRINRAPILESAHR